MLILALILSFCQGDYKEFATSLTFFPKYFIIKYGSCLIYKPKRNDNGPSIERKLWGQTPVTRGRSVILRALLLIAAAMAALIIAGTVYAFARSSKAPVLRLGKPAAPAALPFNDDVRVFNGIGRLRIPLSNYSTLILSIAFPYSPKDRVFAEELAARIGDFRTIAADYFSSLPEENLVRLDEDAAKAEILKRWNARLRLGRIDTLYFSDLLVLD
jgi:flagellar basal body-associated protein FliL